MRSIAIVAGALFALSFPVAAQAGAGEGCAHSKSAAVSASADGTLADPHAACSEACSDSAKAEGACGCNHATSAAEARFDAGSEAVTKVPAASGAVAVTQ